MKQKYIITGCDKNTEWQLPWFVKNFRENATKGLRDKNIKLIIADFGMTTDAYMMAQIDADYVVDVNSNGWFSKVETMWKMKHMFEGQFCWIDTDCQIMRDPSGIFDFIEPEKLTMVVDHPWTENGSPWTPQGNSGPWYNSGVVAFEGRPLILENWYSEVKTKDKHRGDQEALYWLLNLNPMHRAMYISEAPHRYNTLRLDMLQNRVPNNPVILHWTGQKGNDEIRAMMK